MGNWYRTDCLLSYPEELADRSWDNVGLLLGNGEVGGPTDPKPIVMVTNDLTFQVAIDAIAKGVSVIVSYRKPFPYNAFLYSLSSMPFALPPLARVHTANAKVDPFIFSGLKSITHNDPQQTTLIHLARAGIAVYCPHTAVDAAPQGLNTFLADVISGPHKSTRSVAIPCSTAPESHSPAGYGAIGHFEQGSDVPLVDIIHRLSQKLGGLRHVMVASPVGADVKTTRVKSFGVCAGSGYDVLKKADVDLLVTGETSHHSALRAIQQGRTLVTVFHSNSERAYINEELRPRLQAELRQSVPEAEVLISEFDKDPFTIYDVNELSQ